MKPSSKTKSKKSMEMLLFDIPPLPANAIRKTKSKVKRGSKSFVSTSSTKGAPAHRHHHQYRDTIENREEYIKIVAEYSWDKLSKRLDIIHQQMEWAFKQKNHAAHELLYEWEQQTIAARLIKLEQENNKEN